MRGFLATVLASTSLALAVGAASRVDAANTGIAASNEAGSDLNGWDGGGNAVNAEPRAGWRWRPAGDPTAQAALNAAGAPDNALSDPHSGGGFAADVSGLDGAPTEIYTIGGKPLSPAAAAATSTAPEPKGPLAILAKLGPKGMPAPATWALIALGFAMIVVAVRGLWLANRNLARLRSEDEA